MSKKTTFQEQYPDYQIVPEKKKRLEWILIWASFIFMLVSIPGVTLYYLAMNPNSAPNMAGFNQFTLPTMASVAQRKANQGRHKEAAEDFAKYFSVGGDDADMMALYAYSLAEIGRKDEALQWARRAVQTAPQSKAAQMIHNALEPKK